jgi:hypothetical protein
LPPAEKLIAESFRKIVAGSGPSPDTRIALLNQITLPSAIGIGLKESSTALAAVHVLPGTGASPPDLGFTETGAEDGAADFWKLPLASDTNPNPTASERIPAQIRQLLNTVESFCPFSDIPVNATAPLGKEGVSMLPTSCISRKGLPEG